MNLWQKLIMRRLYNEQHSEGGEGGGGTATEPTQETSATDKNEPPANYGMIVLCVKLSKQQY